ncbi:alpha/beta hydrolase [Xinfangfangia sp. CPCC 101601]|uniref:Alpha/beta hydrolase n=1 Tax=Pseudogemmobacter lacusdianii TaxID=3069608 RepID=A0ABU0VVS2_9RHOB|nr:alpha/beta hydrolase [Xinfangfangia sp. CPCC 101601]MDQ2065819.1 alpha/beta hydrolase [Xinfangfangia sp. CPCC 101601]
MRYAVIAIAVLAAAYLAAVLAMLLFQRQFQYFPSQRGPSPEVAGFADAQDYELTAKDGTKLQLWYAPPTDGAPVVLYFQGNGGEIADRRDRWTAYRDAGFGTAFLHYRGYGSSEGSPSEEGFHQDAAAAFGFLLEQGLAPRDIALVGESLGTGVAVRLAADQPTDAPVAALVLEAPYTSTADAAARLYPWLPVRWLMWDQYRSIDRIAEINTPLFVFHGEADQLIPFELGLALFEAAPAPKELSPAPGRGHGAIYDPATWQQEIGFIWQAYLRP